MTRKEVCMIIDHAKDLGLNISIHFIENAVEQVEGIDFSDLINYSVWIDNDDNLHIDNKFDDYYNSISIAKIVEITIHEKVIF